MQKQETKKISKARALHLLRTAQPLTEAIRMLCAQAFAKKA